MFANLVEADDIDLDNYLFRTREIPVIDGGVDLNDQVCLLLRWREKIVDRNDINF